MALEGKELVFKIGNEGEGSVDVSDDGNVRAEAKSGQLLGCVKAGLIIEVDLLGGLKLFVAKAPEGFLKSTALKAIDLVEQAKAAKAAKLVEPKA